MEATLPKGQGVPVDSCAITCHEYRTGLRFTDGVKTLLDDANAKWFLNVIAILQEKARRDLWLREFQLWELFGIRDRKVVIACSRDSEDVAFRLTFGRIEFPHGYLRLYVTLGIACLPREHREILDSQLHCNRPRRNHVLTIERYGRFWSLKENGALLCVAVYKKGANAVKTRIEELLAQQPPTFKRGSDLCPK